MMGGVKLIDEATKTNQERDPSLLLESRLTGPGIENLQRYTKLLQKYVG